MNKINKQTKRASLILFILGVSLIVFGLTGCGQGPVGSAGAPGSPGNSAPASLEGYYVLPNGGYLDLYQDAEGLYTFRQIRIVTPNADGSTGLIPIGNTGTLPITNGDLYYNVSPAYVAGTNNVKQDSNNVLLGAAYLTELTFSRNGSGVQVRVVISSSNGVLFDHTVVSQ